MASDGGSPFTIVTSGLRVPVLSKKVSKQDKVGGYVFLAIPYIGSGCSLVVPRLQISSLIVLKI